MKSPARYFIAFSILLGLSLVARNQDMRRMESIQEGLYMVRAVYVDSQGVKWFGTNNGLCRFDNGTKTWFGAEDHLPGNQVNALSYEQTPEEDILWTGTDKGVSAVSFDGTGVTGSRIYTLEEGLLDTMISAIALDSRGNKFFGSASGISMLSSDTFTALTYFEYYSSMFITPVRQLQVYGDTLYIAQNGGIGRLVSGVDGITGASRWESSYGISPYSGDIKSLLVKGAEVQYFGTDVGVEVHTGYKAKENWSLWNTDSGLVDNCVISIAEDMVGGLWFGTCGGVSHLADGSWTSYTTNDGLLNDTVYDIDFDPDGSVWFATGAGACRLKDGEFMNFLTSTPDHAGNRPVTFDAYYNRAVSAIRITYQLRADGKVSASLYSISGVLIQHWNNLPGLQGTQSAELPLTGPVASSGDGIYVVLLQQGERFGTRKVLIMH
jgi:ligand-binding sensor domain-containing protein